MVDSTAPATDFVDYYQVLGLQPDWDTERLRKELKDIFAGTKSCVNAATGKKKEDINQRLKWITEARKILLDLDAKAKYDLELAEWKRTATPEQKAAAAAIPTLQELWQLIDEGRYVDAIEAGKRLVDSTPDDDKAWEVYGYASFLWHDYRTAIHAAEQTIRCNPRKAEWYADASRYLAAAGQWNEAVVQLNRAIQIEPNSSGYKLALANIYIQHETWSDAEAVLNGVLSQETSNQTARSLMAIVINDRAVERLAEVNQLANNGKKKEARRLLKELKNNFEEAQKFVADEPDLKDLLSSNSILVRRALGVNFYQRLMGFGVDCALALPGFLIMSIDSGTNAAANFFGFLIVLAIWGYSWVWLAHQNNGQDLTKRLLGMQIVNDEENSVPLVGKLITRAVVKPVALILAGFAFYAIIFFLVAMETMGNMFGDGFQFVGAIIGLSIGLFLGFFKLAFDLFFVTDKTYMPNLLGFCLFLHERLTGTTVACSTKDNAMNFAEYHWY